MKRIIILFFILYAFQSTAQRKKTLKELVDPRNASWEIVNRWISSSKTKVVVLPRIAARADSAIVRAQISTDNILGSIIYNSGGILIDNGWVRILGSGCPQMDRSLPQWNKGKTKINSGDIPTFVLVADDAIGGLFAINAGGLDEVNLNRIFYFGPNSLKWEPLGLTYEQFIIFCMSDKLRDFYSDFKWKGWESELASINPNTFISSYPLLWTRDGKELKCNRKVLPVQKLWEIYALKHKELTHSVLMGFAFR